MAGKIGDEMPDYPVMFTVRDTVSGNGFLAGVTLTGRAIMCKEDDKWWVYGVRPGAIAEMGSTPEEAFLRFRNRYKGVLYDFAESSGSSFEAFRTSVEEFYHQPDKAEEDRWIEAFQALRNGKAKVKFVTTLRLQMSGSHDAAHAEVGEKIFPIDTFSNGTQNFVQWLLWSGCWRRWRSQR